MSADLNVVIHPPRRPKATGVEVEVLVDRLDATRLVEQPGLAAEVLIEIERHTGGAVVGQAGNANSLIGHVSTFRGGIEQRHDSGSGGASKLAASAPLASPRRRLNLWPLISIPSVIVTWAGLVWLVSWALS